MTPLDKLKNRYSVDEAPAIVDEEKTVLPEKPDAGWRDSNAILALREWLDGHPGLGAVVGLSGGFLAIRFKPGLVPSEGDRWMDAKEAFGRLIMAMDDLLSANEAGLLRLRVFDDQTIK